MWQGCSCTSRSSGALQAQRESGREPKPAMPNWLNNASETYAYGAKNVASWFEPRIQDKENPGASPGASPGAAAERRARLTFQGCDGDCPSPYHCRHYNQPSPVFGESSAKELANANEPRSPNSVM